MLEAEVALVGSVLFASHSLSRVQKECILFALSATRSNAYCFALHYQTLNLLGVPEPRLDQIAANYQQLDLSTANKALLKFALKLGLNGASFSREDVEEALSLGLSDESLLEAVLSTALSSFLCTLAIGLRAPPDFNHRIVPSLREEGGKQRAQRSSSGPYLPVLERSPEDFVAFFREEFGLIPNAFRAQTLRPDVLDAEADFIQVILVSQTSLTQIQKYCISLAVSVAHQNVYWVGFHAGMLEKLGMPANEVDQIITDHRASDLWRATPCCWIALSSLQCSIRNLANSI